MERLRRLAAADPGSSSARLPATSDPELAAFTGAAAIAADRTMLLVRRLPRPDPGG